MSLAHQRPLVNVAAERENAEEGQSGSDGSAAWRSESLGQARRRRAPRNESPEPLAANAPEPAVGEHPRARACDLQLDAAAPPSLSHRPRVKPDQTQSPHEQCNRFKLQRTCVSNAPPALGQPRSGMGGLTTMNAARVRCRRAPHASALAAAADPRSATALAVSRARLPELAPEPVRASPSRGRERALLCPSAAPALVSALGGDNLAVRFLVTRFSRGGGTGHGAGRCVGAGGWSVCTGGALECAIGARGVCGALVGLVSGPTRAGLATAAAGSGSGSASALFNACCGAGGMGARAGGLAEPSEEESESCRASAGNKGQVIRANGGGARSAHPGEAPERGWADLAVPRSPPDLARVPRPRPALGKERLLFALRPTTLGAIGARGASPAPQPRLGGQHPPRTPRLHAPAAFVFCNCDAPASD